MKRAISVIIFVCIFMLGAINAYCADYVSTADFSSVSFSPLTARASISFTLNAFSLSEGFIGIASDKITPSNYSDYSICFRIREGGYFDANNGSDFGSVNIVNYVAGENYLVEIEADIKNNIYNAYVTPPNGQRCIVADNYAFRASAASLGKITVRGGWQVSAGLYRVSNFSASAVDGEFETFTLPNFYGENMVLQRGKNHKIFGKANDGTKIDVTLSGGGYLSEGTALAQNGEFCVDLKPLPPSLSPYTLTVSSKDRQLVINNVYVGDVYILAGQSNMAQTYTYQTTEQLGGGVSADNLSQRVSDERIKQFTINQTSSTAQTFDVPFKNGSWAPLTDDNNKDFSYIGMFFAAERLNDEPNVPIGMISTAWNGTGINRWIRKSEENSSLNYKATNGDIFNNHISPLVGFPISAILWYQGESDATNPIAYAEAFPNMIKDWRKLWNDESLPFLFVQLARYSKADYSPQRLAQMKALELDNVGMAVILDTDKGTYTNIHPLGKETVSHRLKLLADKYVYQKQIEAQGPLLDRAVVEQGSIRLYFKPDTIGGGLIVKNTYNNTDLELCEFEISSKYGEFTKATAVINSDNTISVSSEAVAEPCFVRYAYSAVPTNANLFNAAELPAAPFNTDTRIWSANTFLSKAYAVGGKIETVHFTMTAFKDNIDGVLSLTASENSIASWSNCGITLRFGTSGYLECRDGGEYKKSGYSYSKNTPYEIKILADFTKNTYSVFINKNGTWEILAQDAAFRTDSLPMTNAARLLVRGGDNAAAQEFIISDFTAEEMADRDYIKSNGAYFAVSADADVYAASYDDNSLFSIAHENAKEGIIKLVIQPTGNEKIFFWNDGLKPQ